MGWTPSGVQYQPDGRDLNIAETLATLVSTARGGA
jgi:hypothetical protein